MTEIEKFNKELSEISYGWHDKNNTTHEKLDKKAFKKYYKMPTLKQMKQNDHAICWELCEVERDFFKKQDCNYKRTE